MKSFFTERESQLAGHVRKLRDALWEQLRRGSFQSREKAIAVLEETRGEFASCPDDQPELWFDTHTIEYCARFLYDCAEERENPERGDPENPVPTFLDPATLRWAADQMRREMPDSTGPRLELEPGSDGRYWREVPR